jgi:hypothetical protein
MAIDPRKRQKKAKKAEVREEEPAESEDTFDDQAECVEDFEEEFDFYSEPTEKDIRQTNRYLRERQQQFLRAAEAVAEELARLPEVKKVVLFGSVAVPLQREVPRFREYRREQSLV